MNSSYLRKYFGFNLVLTYALYQLETYVLMFQWNSVSLEIHACMEIHGVFCVFHYMNGKCDYTLSLCQSKYEFSLFSK